MINKYLFKNLYAGQTAIKNTFWLALAEGINGLLKFFLAIYVARILGAVEYGKFTFALSFVSIFVIFSDFGMSTMATRELSKNKEEKNNYQSFFSLKILLSIASLVLIILCANFITTDPLIKKIVWILSFYAIAINFNQIIYAFFRAQQKMEHEGLIKISQAILITCVGIFVVFKFPSAENLSFGYLFAGVMALIAIIFFFHFKIYPLKISLQKSVWKKILSLSWPLGLDTILGIIPIYIGSVMMGYFHLIAEVGWYNAAMQIINFFIIPSVIISQSFYPIMCKAIESKKSLQKTYNSQIVFKAIILIPLTMGTVLFASKIINLIYGPDFAPSILVLQILMISCILYYMNTTLSQILIAANMQKKVAIVSFCLALASIMLTFVSLRFFGLCGVALSLSAIALLDFLILIILVSKLTPVKPFFFCHIKA